MVKLTGTVSGVSAPESSHLSLPAFKSCLIQRVGALVVIASGPCLGGGESTVRTSISDVDTTYPTQDGDPFLTGTYDTKFMVMCAFHGRAILTEFLFASKVQVAGGLAGEGGRARV